MKRNEIAALIHSIVKMPKLGTLILKSLISHQQEAVFTLYKSFANEKMQSRMNAHPKSDGYEALIGSLGKEVLPKEYGGTNGTLQDHIGK